MVGLAAGGRRRPHYRHRIAAHIFFSFAFYCYALCRAQSSTGTSVLHYSSVQNSWVDDGRRRPYSPISTSRPRQPSSTEHVYLLRSERLWIYSHFYGNVLPAGILFFFFLMLLCVHDVTSDWQAGSQVGSCREHGTLLQIRFMKNKNVILLMTSSFVRPFTDIITRPRGSVCFVTVRGRRYWKCKYDASLYRLISLIIFVFGTREKALTLSLKRKG